MVEDLEFKMENQTITNISIPFINLKKSVTGNIAWDIKVYNENLEEAVLEIEKIDEQLKEKFPCGEPKVKITKAKRKKKGETQKINEVEGGA